MTVEELGRALSLETVVAGDGGREVTGGYCGDLLSWVMGRAPAGCVWLTVMGNVNAIAVAVLADVACILLTEASPGRGGRREGTGTGRSSAAQPPPRL